MPKVAVITDSTATIPTALVQQYSLQVAPQTLIWGTETFRDGVDIQPDEFYQQLSTAKTLPTTAQVSPTQFQELYQNAIDQGQDVIAPLLSSKLSGTVQAALQAKELFPSGHIEVIDTLSTAMALGLIVLEVARAAERGADLAECKTVAEQAQKNAGVFFVVDTLKYLHMGGRIGGGARFLGTAFDLKPILELRDGRIESYERVRTRRKALARLLDIIGQRVQDRHPVHISVFHANVPEEAKATLAQAEECFKPSEAILAELSPVVGTHVGPGTIGIAYLAGM